MTATAEKPATDQPKAGAVPSFTVTLRIARFDPELDSEQHETGDQ